jgi:hypothetical protein
MDDLVLTPEQEAEAERIADIAMAKARVDLKRMARLLASRSDGKLLGETEFQLRDLSHHLAACTLDAALEQRKKRGTRDRA